MKFTDFKICVVIIGIDCYIIKLHLCLFFLNPKYCQNDTWSGTSVLYDKHFYHVFGSMLETGNYFQAVCDFIKMAI